MSHRRASLIALAGLGLLALTLAAIFAVSDRRRDAAPARLLVLTHPDPTSNLEHEIYVVRPDGSGATRVAQYRNSTDHEPCPVWSPDGRQVAFAADRDRQFAVHIVNADGSGLRVLTDPAHNETHPHWLPDGKTLGVVSRGERHLEIYVVHADGSGRRRVTEGAHPNLNNPPVWSPDGKRVAFIPHGPSDPDERATRPGYIDGSIFVVNADGSGLTRVSTHPRRDRDPVWSPDSTRLAFVSEGAIYRVNRDGSELMPLTREPGYHDGPRWSPDGRRIAFGWRAAERDSDQIEVIDADGRNRQRLTRDGDGFWPVWSPDGRQITFVSERDGTRGVWVMQADGSEARRLFGAPGITCLAWGPR